MTTIEKIQGLMETAETEIRKETIKEAIEILADFAKDGVPTDEKPGMRAAIEILRENFRI